MPKERRALHRRMLPLIGAGGLAIVAAALIALSAGVANPEGPDGSRWEGPKSEAPMNINPDKTPELSDDPSIREPTKERSPSEREAAEQAKAKSAEERAKRDYGYFPCFTANGHLAGVHMVDAVKPRSLTQAERQTICDKVFPGTLATRVARS